MVQAFARATAHDLFAPRPAPTGAGRHLEAAVSWLGRAHDASPDDGVSYGYSLKGGWRGSYPETSGYIVLTFFDLARARADADARERAVRIARWLCREQHPTGGIANPWYGAERPIVFDTGQVLSGLVRAFEETGDPAFLDAAEKAGDWLVEIADADGLWSRHTYLGVMHAYNTRVAWPLLSLHALRPTRERERVARANLDWAVARQRDGWFESCGFAAGEAPFTHTIAYALQGLVEAGLLLDEPAYLAAAARGAEAVLGHLRTDGFLPGRIDVGGRPRTGFCCLTGNAQMAIVWLRLFQLSGEARLRTAAERSLRYVMACQDVAGPDADVRGGIKGSQPIWGGYAPFTYPNWAAKFFVDALLLRERVDR